jgi:hypothetical protein
LVFCAVCSLIFAWAAAADAKPNPKVSEYAPADDLVAQVTFFVDRLDKALSDEAAYDEVQQTTVERDSNTLVVVGLALAMHDQDHKLKGVAPALIQTSLELTENVADFAAAQATLAKIKQALAGEIKADDAVEWAAVAAMSPLMMQVPVIHAPMKRGATDERRFKRQAAQTAGQAATLAVIAEASSYNTDHADEEDIPQWQEFCAQMRDACGEINAAVRGGDTEKAATAIVALQKSCDDCHAVFNP